MKYFKFIIIFLLVVSLIVIGYFYYDKKIHEFNDNYLLKTNDGDKENIKVYKEEITSLKEEYNNDEVVGTLEILNTDYKVPIMQAEDNDYYLEHLPDKTKSFMGSIFLDYRVDIDNSQKLLIYGHNSSKYEMPFAILENYYDEEYLKEHKYVEIKTKTKIRKYEVFSVYVATTDYSYMKINYEKDEYLNHLNNLKKYSFYDIDLELDSNDNILILQTCSTHKDYVNYDKKYLIIALKEI
ncbi:MAG: class B sortase [Bacilli bacterium]|nr:class B sortase [Bacilli bacterium]